MTASRNAAASRCAICRAVGAAKRHYRLAGFNVMRCRSCGLIFLDVAMDYARLRELYSQDYFHTRQEYYFHNPVTDANAESSNENIEEFNDSLRAFESLVPDRGKLLDVGCGVGVFLSLAREKGWTATGVDISQFAAQYAREKLDLDVREGTLEEVGFDPESFDVVTFWDSIEHVTDPARELDAVRRVLRRGGYVFLNTPNEAGLLKLLAWICYRGSLGWFRYPVRKLYHIYHLYYLTPETLTRLVEGAGFQVVELKKTLIPIVKARGSPLEKGIVRILSLLERALGREYQLSVIAQKV